jgi:hypothetical protein
MQVYDFYPHRINHGDKDTAFIIFNQVKVKKKKTKQIAYYKIYSCYF